MTFPAQFLVAGVEPRQGDRRERPRSPRFCTCPDIVVWPHLTDLCPFDLRGGIPQLGQGSGQAQPAGYLGEDRKSTRLNSSHVEISYAVFCLKKKKKNR